MEVKILGGNGLHQAEVRAVSRMEADFSKTWYAYASLVMSDTQGSMEIDLMIITHDRLLLVELKEWNGKIVSYDGKWKHNSKEPVTSPYDIKKTHALRIQNILLRELKHKLGYFPIVEAHVVLCGTATPEHLPVREQQYVHTLDEFLTIHNREDYLRICEDKSKYTFTVFEKLAHARPNAPQQITAFKEYFSGPAIQPKPFKITPYEAAAGQWWTHDKELFTEYLGRNPKITNDQALLRRWDFTKLGTGNATQEKWSSIIMREDQVFRRARTENTRLGQYMLRPLLAVTEGEVQEDCAEAYELPRNIKRFDQYLAQHAEKWTNEQRYDHVRALLAPFTELHGLGIAHRDIDSHNLWYSQDQNSIITSGYYASFLPEKATVKDFRDLLKSTKSQLPEDVLSTPGDIIDPFKQDVFLLAQVAHQICFPGRRLERDSNIPVWTLQDHDPFAGALNDFFSKSMDWDTHNRFQTAADMLAEFNRITTGKALSYDDTHEVFDAIISGDFVKRGMNIFSLFQKYQPMEGESAGMGQNIRYKFQDADGIGLLKFWQKASVTISEPGANRRILRLRKRIEQACSVDLPITQILEYGLLESDGFYITTRYEEGDTWSSVVASVHTLEEKLAIANQLCTTIGSIHGHQFPHGDLHPENVLFRPVSEPNASVGTRNLVLIDVIDFGESSEPYNVEYGPMNPASTDGFGRDRYAVYKMIRELFAEDLPDSVHIELQRASTQPDQVPLSLKPMIESLQDAQKKLITADVPQRALSKTIAIVWNNDFLPQEEYLLEKDGEGYHFSCRWDTRDSNLLRCYITGQTLILTITVDPANKTIKTIQVKKEFALSELVEASKKSVHAIIENITIARGIPKVVYPDPLADYILSIDAVLEMLVKRSSPNKTENAESEVFDTVKPQQIWNTLLDKEGEQLLRVEVGEGEITESDAGFYQIPYVQSNTSWLDYFDRDDQVFVYLQGDDMAFGEMVLSEVRHDTLMVRPTRGGMQRKIKSGNVIMFESLRTKASRDRRKRALERVLGGGSKIAHLPTYFDQVSETHSTQVCAVPEEADIRALYDELDGSAERLNSQQIVAFQRVISEGPVSVLQGPPGTGKTAFVSKLIHFLYEKKLAKNILLVGQSHTAVDNVALKAREICQKLGSDISIVRLGHESMIDSQLLQAHPSTLQRQIRHKFHREYDQRINALASRLTLDKDLVSALSTLHRSLYPMMASMQNLNSKLAKLELKVAQGQDKQTECEEVQAQINECAERIENNIQSRHYDIEIPTVHDKNFWDQLSARIARAFHVSDQMSLSRLNKLITISQEWIDVLATGEANYDRFLVKTSQLVCGTLVGMGAKNLSIDESEFDWVIVDEAARAQAAELMIALQSAKRILLVGDHRQLPPQYERKYLRSVANELNISQAEVAKTDFERAFLVNKGITLDTQYRMVQPISDIISACFYADEKGVGGLKTGRGASPDWYKTLPYPLDNAVTWIDSGAGALVTGEEPRGTGFINSHEVAVILHLLKLLTQEDTLEQLKQCVTDEKPYPIGIITMYRHQKDLIKEELSQTEWASPIRNLIKVDTVDAYQGQENRIIFLSLVRDNDITNQGFLGDASRINVALSRAQERLLIVGARTMWQASNCDSALSAVLGFIESMTEKKTEDYELVDGTTVIEGKCYA